MLMTASSYVLPRQFLVVVLLLLLLLLLTTSPHNVVAFLNNFGGRAVGGVQRSQSIVVHSTHLPVLLAAKGEDVDGEIGDGFYEKFYDDFNDNNDDGEDEEFGENKRKILEDEMLEFSIDSFLRGDYDGEFADDAPAPNPLLTPQQVISSVLESLGQLDYPGPSHGAAVLLRFCVPLSRGERWGDTAIITKGSSNSIKSSTSRSSTNNNYWKGLMRGALTAKMLARRLRASELSCLLNWEHMDVTSEDDIRRGDNGMETASSSPLAFVDAVLYLKEGVAPTLVQFTLRKINSVWLIDAAQLSQAKLFAASEKRP